MNTAEVRTLFAYNSWANQRLLDASLSLAPGQFTRDLQSSFGSIRDTLLHIMAGEWRWLQFWLGKPYDEEFRPEDYPDVAALERRWSTVSADQQRFLDDLMDDTLRATRVVRGAERPLSDTVQHVLTHSTYHRGQVVRCFGSQVACRLRSISWCSHGRALADRRGLSMFRRLLVDELSLSRPFAPDRAAPWTGPKRKHGVEAIQEPPPLAVVTFALPLV
jgi:uncharacterized damage-inducible protein DinB